MNEGLEPDKRLYEAVIKYYCRLGELQLALETLDNMKVSEELVAINQNLLLHSCIAAANWYPFYVFPCRKEDGCLIRIILVRS
jgi:pentatricopeptide repeat protein